MPTSPFKTALVWIAGALIVSLAYNKMGWPGVVLAVGALIFWMAGQELKYYQGQGR